MQDSEVKKTKLQQLNDNLRLHNFLRQINVTDVIASHKITNITYPQQQQKLIIIIRKKAVGHAMNKNIIVWTASLLPWSAIAMSGVQRV